MSTYPDRAKKKVKILKLENFNQTSKSELLQIVDNFDQIRGCPLFRGFRLFKERQTQKYKVEKRNKVEKITT